MKDTAIHSKRKKVLLMYNGSAGIKLFTKDISSEITSAIEYLSERQYEVTVYPIIPSSDLTSESILKETGKKFDLVFVCGGDGTLNHAVGGLVEQQLNIPIAYLPEGSTNDFSKSLFGSDHIGILDICKFITDGATYQCDAGKFNDRCFNYVAGFGVFPSVSYTTSQDWKNSIGYAAYVFKLLGELPSGLGYKRYCRIVHDGIEEEGEFMFGLLTNSVSVAGMQPELIKNSSLNDGLFEAMLVSSDLDPLKIADVLVALNSDSPKSDNILIFRAKHIEFYFDEEVPWTLDGEDGGVCKDAVLDVIPKAVTYYVPKSE